MEVEAVLSFCLCQRQQEQQNPSQRQVASRRIEPLLQAMDATTTAATAEADGFYTQGKRNICVGGGDPGVALDLQMPVDRPQRL